MRNKVLMHFHLRYAEESTSIYGQGDASFHGLPPARLGTRTEHLEQDWEPWFSWLCKEAPTLWWGFCICMEYGIAFGNVSRAELEPGARCQCYL